MNRLAVSRHPILACYLPLHDPAIQFDQADVYAECGVDIFEIGVPAPRPWMDGETIKSSMQRVLGAGVTQADIGNKIRDLRTRFQDRAFVVMGYENMSLQEMFSDEVFPVDAVLKIGNVKSDDGRNSNYGAEIHNILFLPFDSVCWDEDRIRGARGYIMMQAVPGKTGLKEHPDASSIEKISMIKRLGVRTPVLLGIGISTPEHAAAAIAMGADGVIIGSECIESALRGESSLRAYLKQIRSAIDAK